MDTAAVLTIIGSILVPTLCGFGYVLSKMGAMEERLNQRLGLLENRLTRIETIQEGMGWRGGFPSSFERREQ
jgi:hypothetical protein